MQRRDREADAADAAGRQEPPLTAMTDTPHRRVRSFVRRPGRMTTSQARALEELWPTFGIEFDEQALNLADVFGRDADVVLEIGYGNGDTLVEMAAANPEQNFLGVEVHEPGVGH